MDILGLTLPFLVNKNVFLITTINVTRITNNSQTKSRQLAPLLCLRLIVKQETFIEYLVLEYNASSSTRHTRDRWETGVYGWGGGKLISKCHCETIYLDYLLKKKMFTSNSEV